MQNEATVLPRLRGALLLSLCALATTFPACDNGPTTAATVELNAPSTTLYIGRTMQLTTVAKDKAGKELTDRPVTYASSADNVATVSPAGVVLGVSAGAAAITSTVDGVTARLSLVVTPIPVSKITFPADTATIFVAGTRQLVATALDSAGHVLSDRTYAWSSSDQTVATVSSSGLVTGVAAGSATITATTDGKSASVRVTVALAPVASIDITPTNFAVNEGNDLQLVATLKDASGHVLTGRTVNWSSSDTKTATVSSSGLLHGVAPGPVTIMVTSGNVFGTVVGSVLLVPAGSVKISQDTASVLLGSTVQLSATVKDTAGVVLPNKRVTWTSLNTAVATVDSTGKVSGVAFGITKVVASVNSVADTATISVVGNPVASLEFFPLIAEVGVGQTGQIQAIMLDANGNPTSAPVSWFITDSTVASVNSNNVVTGLKAGSVLLYGSTGGKLGAVRLTVSTFVVNTITVTSPTNPIAVNATTQLAVTMFDATGVSLSNRFTTYASSNNAVARVSRTGVVTGIAPGTATISVSSEGKTGTIDITVQ